jgi:hypothetical protein
MRIILRLFGLAGLLLVQATVFSQDTNLWVFLCFGQSNMEGFPGIQEQDKTGVDERFQALGLRRTRFRLMRQPRQTG